MDLDKSDLHRERMEAIFNVLAQRGSVRVVELQQILGVSDMTVRRCLNAMEADGLIRRYHGGAVFSEDAHSRFSAMRYHLNTKIKELMAQKAMDLMPESSSIYLDSSTTSLAVAKCLASSGKKMNVITNSYNVTSELKSSHAVSATLLGGALCDDMTTFDGPFAAEAATKVALDVCFFSADSFDEDRIENKYLFGATPTRILLPRSKKKILIADSSKYAKHCCFMFCGWDEVDIFLTDSFLPAKAKKTIAGKGVEIVIVTESVPDKQ